MLSQHANLGSRSNILSTTPVSACSATPSNATAYRSLLRPQSLPMYGIARDVLKDPNYWADEPIGEDE